MNLTTEAPKAMGDFFPSVTASVTMSGNEIESLSVVEPCGHKVIARFILYIIYWYQISAQSQQFDGEAANSIKSPLLLNWYLFNRPQKN